MNPDDLARILDELGQRLGPAGSEAWGVLVTQKANEAAAWATFYGIATTVTLILAGLTLVGGTLLAILDRETGGFGDVLGGTVLVLILLSMPFAFFQYHLIEVGLKAANPSYYALRDILSVVSP